MKKRTFAIALLLLAFASFAHAQTLLTPKFYMESDTGNVVAAYNTAWPDSEFSTERAYSVIAWALPTAHRGEVDSIGIWCEIPAGASIQICTANGPDSVAPHNFWILKTLWGPLPYGLYTAPFGLPPYDSSADFVAVQVTNGTAYLDAACSITNDLSVAPELSYNSTYKLTYNSTDSVFHWYTFPLLQEVYIGTLEDAKRHLPHAFYIASNRQKYLFGE